MAKKAKKVSKKVAEVAVAETNVIEQVFAGLDIQMGVDPAVRENAYDPFAVGKGIDWEALNAEEEKAEEKTVAIEIPVGGFNRNGMDAMLNAQVGPMKEAVVNVAAKVNGKKTKIVIGKGYRGTVREMLLEGRTGEEIIKKIASMYQEKGETYEYGFARGKRILGDMELELKRGVYGTE